MCKKIIVLFPLLLILTSCGPIIGQLMRTSEGVKDFRIIAGDLADLDKAKSILVVGPFAKAPGAYYIARGDEAGMFYQEINAAKKLHAELYIGERYGDLDRMNSHLRSMGSTQLKDELNLQVEPDLVLFATILERDTITAPLRGLIMRVGYRLEIFNPATNGSTIVEITVKVPFKDCIKLVVSEIFHRAEIAAGR